MESIGEDYALPSQQRDSSNEENNVDVWLSGVIFGRSFRSHYASYHVAQVGENHGTPPPFTLLSPKDGGEEDSSVIAYPRVVIVRVQFPFVHHDTDADFQEARILRTKLRSHCKRFGKHGDWLQVRAGSTRNYPQILWQAVSVDTAWNTARLVVHVNSIQRLQQSLIIRQRLCWTIPQCQGWQALYNHDKKENTFAEKKLQQKNDVDDDEEDYASSSPHANNNPMMKRWKGQCLARFMLHMIMDKLKRRDDGSNRLDPSEWASTPIACLPENEDYNNALAYFNGGTVLDVAGGAGFVSYTLGMAGIPSTIVDPRNTDLPRRDRQAWKRRLNSNQPAKQVQSENMKGRNSMSLGSAAALVEKVENPIDRIFSFPTAVPYARYRAWFGTPPNGIDAHFRGQDEKSKDTTTEIIDSNHPIMERARMLVALHPDEATDLVVDMAVKRKIPFVIVPCCVFFRLFPERKLQGDGESTAWRSVSNYSDLIAYLIAKDPDHIRKTVLPFAGKNVAVWATYEDCC